MRVRAIRVGRNAYLIDVFHNGEWHEWSNHITITRRQVRAFIRSMEGTN